LEFWRVELRGRDIRQLIPMALVNVRPGRILCMGTYYVGLKPQRPSLGGLNSPFRGLSIIDECEAIVAAFRREFPDVSLPVDVLPTGAPKSL